MGRFSARDGTSLRAAPSPHTPPGPPRSPCCPVVVGNCYQVAGEDCQWLSGGQKLGWVSVPNSGVSAASRSSMWVRAQASRRAGVSLAPPRPLVGLCQGNLGLLRGRGDAAEPALGSGSETAEAGGCPGAGPRHPPGAPALGPPVLLGLLDASRCRCCVCLSCQAFKQQ